MSDTWTLSHILERFIIHLFSGGSVFFLAFTGLDLCQRKRWLPRYYGWWHLALPALLSFLFISLREVFDVAAGGWYVKSITDWISWVIGLGAAVYAVYRHAPRWATIVAEIKEDNIQW